MEKRNERNDDLYTVILQNNASKEFTVLEGLRNVSLSHLYLRFDDVEVTLTDGEYTYCCFVNNRDDVEYSLTTPILDCEIITGEGTVLLSDLHPAIGLLRVGHIDGVYNNMEERKTFIFYERDERGNE